MPRVVIRQNYNLLLNQRLASQRLRSFSATNPFYIPPASAVSSFSIAGFLLPARFGLGESSPSTATHGFEGSPSQTKTAARRQVFLGTGSTIMVGVETIVNRVYARNRGSLAPRRISSARQLGKRGNRKAQNDSQDTDDLATNSRYIVNLSAVTKIRKSGLSGLKIPGL